MSRQIYTSFQSVYNDVLRGVFRNEEELRQAFVEALKVELNSSSCHKHLVNSWLRPALDKLIGSRKPDIIVSNLVIEIKAPRAGLDLGRKQLLEYMELVFERTDKRVDVFGIVTDGERAELWIKREGSGKSEFVFEGKMPDVAKLALDFFCSHQKIPVIEADDLIKLFGVNNGSEISHNIIKSFFKLLDWYQKNPSIGRARIVLNYYNMWESLHATFVNVPREGWKALSKLANRMKIGVPSGKASNEGYLFLFAIETYLHFFARALSLSKLGYAPTNLEGYIGCVEGPELRSIFAPSIFEWFHEAYRDETLPSKLKDRLSESTNTLLRVLYNLNVTTLTVDIFRNVYQNILPKPIRRSLGEFYTREGVIDEVLEACGLDENAIRRLYEEWKSTHDIPKLLILDPACGTGSFLVRVIRLAFEALGCKPDIIDFLSDVLVGIDINPFVVELAKLNILLAMAEEMHRCHSATIPHTIRVFWADSLTIYRNEVDRSGCSLIKIDIPALAEIVSRIGSEGKTEIREIVVPYLPNFSPQDLLDVAYDHATKGFEVRHFIDTLKKLVDPHLIDIYRNVLEELFVVIREMLRRGDERLIELIKNALVVPSLKESCAFVIGNPPWVRVHRIAKHVRSRLKKYYKYYARGSAYNPGFRKTKVTFKELHDYSIAFVERGLEFLREGGVLGYVITSKITKALYAGAMRKDIVSNYEILEIRDYSLNRISLFQDVENYPLILAIRKAKPNPQHKVRVTVANIRNEKRTFEVLQSELPLDKNDLKSPWILAPQHIIAMFRKVVSQSLRLGDAYSIYMGVMTQADKLFVVESLKCRGTIAKVNMKDRDRKRRKGIDIEARFLHPLVRGRDINPFKFECHNYIILPYDIMTFDPLWDPDQKFVLEKLGLLKYNVKVKARGSALIYEPSISFSDLMKIITNDLQPYGFTVMLDQYAGRTRCEIIRNNKTVLKISLEELKDESRKCRVYVEGLEIPEAPNATRYFIGHLEKLVKRSAYKGNMPPWAVFSISQDRFRDFRVTWAEIAKHLEACILPVSLIDDICGRRVALIVPSKKVFFFIDENGERALKMLIYLNSELARSIMKLIAWPLKNGCYGHQAASVGNLSIPFDLYNCKLWKWLIIPTNADLNDYAKRLYEERQRELTTELIEALGIDWEGYKKLREWSMWLNE